MRPALLFTKYSNKTGTLRYFITTEKIGTSADDKIFGSVRSTWQGREVRNLYLSTIEVENTSSKDYENLLFKIYSAEQTILLNGRTEVVGTPYVVSWSEKYKNRLYVPDGEQATEQQTNEYNHNREYELPVFNRGQKVRFSCLCTNPSDDNQPGVFISTPSKGIRLKQRVAPYLVISPIFGVPIPVAIIRAFIISILVVIATGLWIENVWIAAGLCMLIGLTGQIFGAIAYKVEQFVKNLIAG